MGFYTLLVYIELGSIIDCIFKMPGRWGMLNECSKKRKAGAPTLGAVMCESVDLAMIDHACSVRLQCSDVCIQSASFRGRANRCTCACYCGCLQFGLQAFRAECRTVHHAYADRAGFM